MCLGGQGPPPWSAAAPGEGIFVSGMPEAAKSSSRRLGAPGRAGSTPWTESAHREGPSKASTPVATKRLPRTLVELGWLWGWSSGFCRGAMP